MKAKFLWASLLLFAGLTACTDDDLNSQQGNNAAGEGTPAYLTISFSANGGSSTRANGDTHGDQEDSKHYSTGITGEAAVNQVLVVVSPTAGTGGSGFAKLYSVSASQDDGSEEIFEKVGTTSTEFYHNSEPIEITTGEYNVLVVVNPVKALADQVPSGSSQNDVSTLYNNILNGQYDYTPASEQTTTYTDNYTNAANSIGMGLGYDGGTNTTKPSFMMANKALATVTVTNENTKEKPAQVDVSVERVLSKITFREKPANGVAANAYPIEMNLSKPAITEIGAIQDEGGDNSSSYTLYVLNKAKDAAGNDVWVRYDEDGKFVGVYKKGSETVDESTTITNKDDIENTQESTYIFTVLEAKLLAKYNAGSEDEKAQWYAVNDLDDDGTLDDTEKSNLELQFDPTQAATKETWYVQLQGYALVNLSKTVNYVRHTVGNGDMGNGVPFGLLNGSNYLWTPNWAAKNSVTYTTDESGDVTFAESVKASDWFYNTLSAVSDESKKLAVSGDGINFEAEGIECFKSFKDGLLDVNGSSTVTGEDHYTDPEKLPNVGKLMTYCFENSTDVDHQIHGLSTGIAFVARVYSDANCTQPIENLYLFREQNYTSLQQIKEAWGNITPELIDQMIAGTEQETPENLEKAGVTKYSSNICYYYTTEIKHFDNGKDEVMGNMEYAIMRNNIYSLSVSTISGIGSPFVDPTPNTPNESVKAALDVNVYILPWIVRYNDIEF